MPFPTTTRVTCVLCGGDGYVSEETATRYGRYPGDTRCPECDGSGRVVNRPRVPTPKEDPRPDDWTCPVGHRNRARAIYCPCGHPRPY